MSTITDHQTIEYIVEIPKNEQEAFASFVKDARNKYIRKSQEIVDEVFYESDYETRLRNGIASIVISEIRECAWQKFLIEEAHFNAIVIKDLRKKFKTPENILEKLIEIRIIDKTGDEMLESLRDVCGEYAGIISPYIYALSLSNTQSRRSRAGKTFEAVIYKIYEILGYPFDSQGKVGKKVFDQAGLGKKVDSILPSLDAYSKRRNKTIIGTMKTTLRERWQEVAEEISRTNIPEIHLLTVDDDISKSKAAEMANHNIVVVADKKIAEGLNFKNVISFEEYLYEEIPQYLEYWK